MAEPMTLTIITPDAIVYDGKADFFVGHAIDGEFGVCLLYTSPSPRDTR